jgi:hypothetical protein
VGDATAQVLGVGADGLEGIEDGEHQLVAVARGSIRKLLFGEPPDTFVGVELRGVGGQSDEVESLGLAAELSNEASAVRSAAIPEDGDVAAEMPEQVAQEVTGLQLAGVVVVFPTGAHVLATVGVRRNPDSSAKTRWAPSRVTFFLPAATLPERTSRCSSPPFPGLVVAFPSAAPPILEVSSLDSPVINIAFFMQLPIVSLCC